MFRYTENVHDIGCNEVYFVRFHVRWKHMERWIFKMKLKHKCGYVYISKHFNIHRLTGFHQYILYRGMVFEGQSFSIRIHLIRNWTNVMPFLFVCSHLKLCDTIRSALNGAIHGRQAGNNQGYFHLMSALVLSRFGQRAIANRNNLPKLIYATDICTNGSSHGGNTAARTSTNVIATQIRIVTYALVLHIS